MPHVLLVDDEESILTLVEYNLQRAGFETSVMMDGLSAYEQLVSSPLAYDLIILDVMLPGMDGLEVCKRLRQKDVRVPVIILTARDEEIDRIVGLEIGADDYVTKPFSPRELVARARAVLRRSESVSEPLQVHRDSEDKVLDAGGIQMHLSRHEVTIQGKPIELTPKEFDLLQHFMENHQRVLSRDQLLDRIWGYSAIRDTRIVDVHVAHLRDKLSVDGVPSHCIRTVRGIGYKFVGYAGR